MFRRNYSWPGNSEWSNKEVISTKYVMADKKALEKFQISVGDRRKIRMLLNVELKTGGK